MELIIHGGRGIYSVSVAVGMVLFFCFFDVVHKIASHPPTEGSASVFCQSLAPSPTRAIR